VQAQIINLLMDLQKEFKLTYIFISHNLGVVEYLSDEVLVMHNGMMKELSTTEEIYKFPKNEYTKSLIESVPKMPSPEELMARKEARKKLF
jgi:ABC-type oligopeptide transport system ATPase subunit